MALNNDFIEASIREYLESGEDSPLNRQEFQLLIEKSALAKKGRMDLRSFVRQTKRLGRVLGVFPSLVEPEKGWYPGVPKNLLRLLSIESQS